MKTFYKKIAKYAALGLILSLFSPTPVAQGSNNITKTFSIRGANDALLPGAQVQVFWWDESTQTESFADIATANAQGIATVANLDPTYFLQYIVVPPAGDVTNAITGISNLGSITETVNVKLKAANMVVEVLGTDNNPISANEKAYLLYPRSSTANDMVVSRVIRSGAFGIALPTLSTTSTYRLHVAQNVDTWQANRFSWRYGLKATGNAGSQSYTVYQDLSATQVLEPVNGVYKLAYKSGNLSGTIRNADGTALTIPSGVRGSLNISPVVADPSGTSSSVHMINSTISPNGEWYARLTGPAGQYLANFNLEGSHTIPSFSTFIWKNAEGAFSTTEAGPYATSGLQIRIPADINFKMKLVKPGTTDVLRSNYNIYNSTTKANAGSGSPSNGLASGVIPNGEYIMDVYPFDQNYTNSQYKISVASGVVTVRDATNQIVEPVSGVYNLSPQAPNLKIKVVNSSNQIIENAWIEIRSGSTESGEYVAGNGSGNSWIGFKLANGTYNAVIYPGNAWNTYKERRNIQISVSSGVATITSPTFTKDSDDVYSVPLETKNFRFKLVSAANNANVLTQGWIDYCTVNSSFDPNTRNNCNGDGIDNLGLGGAILSDGYYLLNVNPAGDTTDAKNTYKVTVSSGVASVQNMDNSSVTPVDGRYVLSGLVPNLTGSITQSSGAITFENGQGVDVALQRWISEKQYWEWTNSAWRSSGTYGFSVQTLGKYRIFAQPRGFADLSAKDSTVFELIEEGGVKKLRVLDEGVDDASPGTAETTLALNIVLPAPNFKIKLVDPRDNSLMRYGWISIQKVESDNRWIWVQNMDMNSQNPGLAGANLSDGEYQLEVNPQNGPTLLAGLARKRYKLVVSGATLTLTQNGTNVAATDGRFTLTPASSNITGRLVDASGVAVGSGNDKWVNINPQKFNAAENRWDWTDNWSGVDQDGFFSMSVTEVGKYRLRIEPFGFDGATNTYTEEFEITSANQGNFALAFGNIVMSAPTLRAKVVFGNDNAILHAGVEVRKNNAWLEWVGTGQNGIANFSFKEAGEYELIVHPTLEQTNLGATRKSYSATVTQASNGTFSATVANAPVNSNIYSLSLGTGNLSGIVYAPDGTTPIKDAQVVPVDTSSQREYWEYSANTSNAGKFSLSLPQGTYNIFARAPWGQSNYGNSLAIGTVTVDSSGNSTTSAANRTTSTFNLSLRAPTWSGTVRTPLGGSDAVVAYASVCLYTSDIWTCSNSNAQGQWAMSAPNGFTSFSENSFLEVRDDRYGLYPMRRFNGGTEVNNALGGTSGSDIALRFKGSNMAVTVKATNSSGTRTVPYVWVNLDADQVGWIGGGRTSANGVANFTVDTSTVTVDKKINIRIDLNGNKDFSSSFASTVRTVTVDSSIFDSLSTGVFEIEVSLDSPNLRGVVREPNNGGAQGSLSPWSWIELFEEVDGQTFWKSGANTDELGQFTMFAEKPVSGTKEYTLVVNPSWNTTAQVSRRQYTVNVTSDNVVSVSVKGSNTQVGTTPVGALTYYAFTLASPSVTGTVVNPAQNGVRDSWVVPISTNSATFGEYLWQLGTNSKNNGAFAMALADGSYKLEANVPWNATELSKSAQCAITIANGSVTTAAGGCVQNGGTVKLQLRAPNVTLTLKKPDGTTNVPYANVGVSVGGWYTNAQSNKDGQVSLFIDKAAIKAANSGLTGTRDINVWVDPPWGTSDIVRWNCISGDSKPLCSGLEDINLDNNDEYPTKVLGNVNFAGPNTKLRVMKPDNSAGIANSWVSIFEFNPSQPEFGMRWVAGSNTDSNGYAAFNIDTSTAMSGDATRYKVEVNPPWNNKTLYSQKWYGDGAGLELNQIHDQTFAIGTPNLTIKVKAPGGLVASKWGWVGVEEVNSSDQYVSWLGGFGLDDNGATAITLAANKRYRLFANPSSGRPGTRTDCIVTTDTSTVTTVVSCGSYSMNTTPNPDELTITLYSGNVAGTVKDPNGAVLAGAIIYAFFDGNVANAVTAVTDSTGVFGLQLDHTKTWTIRILPLNSTTMQNLEITNVTPPSSGTLDLGVKQLAAKS